MFKTTNVRSVVWIVTGFVACPCHLPLTIPILLGITAGTALGAFLANNLWLLGAVSTMYFLGALVLGIRALGQTANDGTATITNSSSAQPSDEARFACCLPDERKVKSASLTSTN